MKCRLSCKKNSLLMLPMHIGTDLGRCAYHRSAQCTMVIEVSAVLRCMCLLRHVTCLPVGI